MELWAKKAVLLNGSDIVQAVEKAGFTPRLIKATVTGRISSVSDQMVLTVQGGKDMVMLGEGPKLEELRKQPEIAARDVTITGVLESKVPKGHRGHPSVLHVESFTMATEESKR